MGKVGRDDQRLLIYRLISRLRLDKSGRDRRLAEDVGGLGLDYDVRGRRPAIRSLVVSWPPQQALASWPCFYSLLVDESRNEAASDSLARGSRRRTRSTSARLGADAGPGQAHTPHSTESTHRRTRKTRSRLRSRPAASPSPTHPHLEKQGSTHPAQCLPVIGVFEMRCPDGLTCAAPTPICPRTQTVPTPCHPMHGRPLSVGRRALPGFTLSLWSTSR